VAVPLSVARSRVRHGTGKKEGMLCYVSVGVCRRRAEAPLFGKVGNTLEHDFDKLPSWNRFENKKS
jgi:hypothetical protein